MPGRRSRKGDQGAHPAGKRPSNGANLGFEPKLWLAADKLRNNMDAAEYKHVVLGLIFLKYISDAFQERYEALKADKDADPEDRDEYTAENVFWVPKEARWATHRARCHPRQSMGAGRGRRGASHGLARAVLGMLKAIRSSG
jgi:hypothetical protein